MDESQFRHQSDSRYCFCLGDGRVLLRLSVAKEVALDRVEALVGDPITFGGGKHTAYDMALRHEDRSFKYYEVEVRHVPARYMYCFKLHTPEGSFFFSEAGLTREYEYGLAFLNAYQFIAENPVDYSLVNPRFEGDVFYQVFPERFASDPSLDKDYVNTPWNSKNLKGKPFAFLGGDLVGATKRLPYLKDIGVDVVYLTPIHPSPSNHKYDVLDYFDVDPRFGGKEAFGVFVEKTHRLDMKVMMDLVFNHCSYNHPFFQDVLEKGKKSPYYSWFFIDGDKPHKSPLNYACFGFFWGMPKLNTNNPEVQEYLLSVASYWMDEFGIDGYRLDVSEGVSHEFWMKMKMRLKAKHPDVLLIGENWLNGESYLGPNQFDGLMNYPFLGAVSGYVLKRTDAKKTAQALEGLLMRYKQGHTHSMMNLIASHDVQRFFTLCNANKELSLIGHAMLMFYPGFPMIYYGEEIFMEGGGDPENRHGMDWESKEFTSASHKLFRDLVLLRKRSPLRKGDCVIDECNGALRISRFYEGEKLTLVCNLTDKGISIDSLGNAILGSRVAGGELWPQGFAVIQSHR